MKNPNMMNPWVIVRWAFVTTLFAGTVIVAMDQVKTRDALLIVAAKKNDFLKKELSNVSKQASELGKNIVQNKEETRQAIAEANAGIKRMQSLIDSQLQHNLTEINAIALQPVTPSPSLRPRHYATAAPSDEVVLTESLIPVWLPGAPSVITKGIKDRANIRWNKDYSMVNYQIDKDTKDYEMVVRYYKTANPSIKDILNRAAKQWGTDYGMIIYEIEKQIQAKQKLDNR